MNILKKSLKKLHRSLKENEREIKKWEKQNKTPKNEKQIQSRLGEILTAVCGLLVIALAITGIVFSSLFIHHVKTHKKEEAYQSRMEYYTDLISPVVLFDTGEFTHPENANNLSLLIPAFFKAQEMVFAGREDREYVTETDLSKRYVLHEADVQAAARSLFGREVICQTFYLDGLKFEYKDSERYYLSTITMRLAMYTPKIVSYTTTDKGVDLIVEYMEVATGKEYRLGKTMKITLEGEYQKEIITAITAIQ